MNQLAPIELCEKLQLMGCVSESGFYYQGFENSEKGIWFELLEESKCFPGLIKYYAFCQNDFTGATEQSHENARLVWGTEPFSIFNIDIIDCSYPSISNYESKDEDEPSDEAWIIHRHIMVDLHLSNIREPEYSKYKNWHEYLEGTMRVS